MLHFNYTFWTDNGRTLNKPDLACLRQDHYRYKTLLLQLVGKIEYDSNGIQLADKNLATAKFNLFIEKAIAENVELAITPEYSCPWTSIESFIAAEKLPSEEKLWIIGCQSIKPKELKDLTGRHNNVVWIYDEALINQSINENKFLDPVCLFFKTKDNNNQTQNIIVVQFKTCSFGGADSSWERDNFIQGNTFYVIENRIKSTKLVTLICSDTLQNLDFNAVNEGYFLGEALLLIHIQLNQKPFESAYKLYRNMIYMYGLKEDYNKELICLNWARGVSYSEGDTLKIFNKYGGSAFYCKTNKLDRKKEKINQNHSKGLYYTNWDDKKSHVYFLNYDEFAFLIDNTKPSQEVSLPAQRERSGPKIIETYRWNNLWEAVGVVEDGFSQVCAEIEDATGNLICLKDNNDFTEVERIIQLSSGEIDISKKEEWYQIFNLLSFQIGDTEYNQRNTFSQDPDIPAHEDRKRRIQRYHILKNSILNDPMQVPIQFANSILEFDGTLRPENNIYLLNLHSKTTGRKGTAIYLGEKTHSEAKAFKANIESYFREDHQGKQVMVWYVDTTIKRIYDEDNKPEINENVSKSPVSFKKTK